MKKWILLLLPAAAFSSAAAGASAEKEVLTAMNTWKQATIAKDRAALDKLLHADLTFSHSSGQTMAKPAVLDYFTAANRKSDSIEFSDVSVRVYGNTALVKCTVDSRSTADGKGSSSAHLAVLHVWVKTHQGWQLVARQPTKLTP
jgi:ketosteroid isomerase-like protein